MWRLIVEGSMVDSSKASTRVSKVDVALNRREPLRKRGKNSHEDHWTVSQGVLSWRL